MHLLQKQEQAISLTIIINKFWKIFEARKLSNFKSIIFQDNLFGKPWVFIGKVRNKSQIEVMNQSYNIFGS